MAKWRSESNEAKKNNGNKWREIMARKNEKWRNINGSVSMKEMAGENNGGGENQRNGSNAAASVSKNKQQ
jgi:hypothetical protein